MYIYDMPYRVRHQLVDILNVNDVWRELAGNYMGYSQTDLEKFRRAGQRAGESPADALLTSWGQKNHSVPELFKLLYNMKHFQAMDAIKSCVDEKYHKYIRYAGAGPSTTLNMTLSEVRTPTVPPPPTSYSRARDPNLCRFGVEKEDWKEKKIVVEIPSDTTSTRSQNIEASRAQETNVENLPGAESLRPNHEGLFLNVPEKKTTEPGGLGGSPGASSTALRTCESSRLKQRNPSGIPLPDSDLMLKTVPFDELKKACNNFSHDNLLGRGGFGEVYRGKWNRQDVAVKRIREDRRVKNDPGFQKYVNQAITELQALHAFPAENILPLMAFHFAETLETDPCLVYQYMPNGSVSDRLRCKNGTIPLSWKLRANVALGTARGLCYLHANSIIHGDIKGPNILLDKHFEPKIGDFGLARGGPDSDEFSYRVVSSVQGTASYLPEDFVRSRHLTAAVDTFCYGIFLFELVTGKSPSWEPQGTHKKIRDIFLEARSPRPWVDPLPGEESPWTNWLFLLGRDCAKANRKNRPQMQNVFSALEQLYNAPAAFDLFQKFKHSQAVPSLPPVDGACAIPPPQDVFRSCVQTVSSPPPVDGACAMPLTQKISSSYIKVQSSTEPQSVNEAQSEAAAIQESNLSDGIPIFLKSDYSSKVENQEEISTTHVTDSTFSHYSFQDTSTESELKFEIDDESLSMLSEYLKSQSLNQKMTHQEGAALDDKKDESYEPVGHQGTAEATVACPESSRQSQSGVEECDVPDLPDGLLINHEDPFLDDRLLAIEDNLGQLTDFPIFK